MISSSSIQRKPASPQIFTGGTYGAAHVAPFFNSDAGKYIFLSAKALVK